MSPNCIHYRDGACAIRQYGGRPSRAACAKLCQQRQPLDADKPALLPMLVKGAIGLTKFAIGADRASDDLIAARREACKACDQWTGARCKRCGCLTHAKTALKSERCPLNRWPTPSPASQPPAAPDAP